MLVRGLLVVKDIGETVLNRLSGSRVNSRLNPSSSVVSRLAPVVAWPGVLIKAYLSTTTNKNETK